MRIEQKTSLGKNAAHKKIDSLLSALQKKYAKYIREPDKSWNGSKDVMSFSVSIYGFSVKGTVTLEDSVVVLEGGVPLLAKPFQGKIRSAIRSVMEEELE